MTTPTLADVQLPELPEQSLFDAQLGLLYTADQMRAYGLACRTEWLPTEWVEGTCEELGSDAEGQPRLIIHSTVESIRSHGRALLYRNVRVSLAQPVLGGE